MDAELNFLENFQRQLCIALQGNGLHYLCIGKSTGDVDKFTQKNRYDGIASFLDCIVASRVQKKSKD